MRTRWDNTAQAAASYGEWKPQGRSHGQPGTGIGEHRVAVGDGRPAAGVDVQREEADGLRGGRIEVPVARDEQVCGVPVLSHVDLGAGPIAIDPEHGVQRLGVLPVRVGGPGESGGGEALPEAPARRERPRPEQLDLYPVRRSFAGHLHIPLLVRKLTSR